MIADSATPFGLTEEHEVTMGQNVPEFMSVPWSGPQRRRRPGRLVVAGVLGGLAIWAVFGVGTPALFSPGAAPEAAAVDEGQSSPGEDDTVHQATDI